VFVDSILGECVSVEENWKVFASLFPAGWQQIVWQSGGVERLSGFPSPDMPLRMLMLHAFEGEIKMSAQMAPSPVWNDSPCFVRDPRTQNIVVLHFAIHRSRTRPTILARVVAACQWFWWIFSLLLHFTFSMPSSGQLLSKYRSVGAGDVAPVKTQPSARANVRKQAK